MSAMLIFAVGIGTTALVSLLAVGHLKQHLRRILIDLCGTEERANFWTAFSNITLILVPLIFAMHYRPQTGPDTVALFEIGNQIEWALIGLVLSILVLGIVISRFMPAGPRLGPKAGNG
jgi:hypothetical protein